MSKQRGAAVLSAIILLSTAMPAFASDQDLVFGSATGLHRLGRDGGAQTLWSGGEVKKILKSSAGWFILSDAGVLFSPDLASFRERNAGLTVKTLKVIKNREKTFVTAVQELKDLEMDPEQEGLMATCTKDEVFLSRDAGLSWKAFPTPVASISGLKGVAVFSKPRLTLIASHPIKGLWALHPDDKTPAWTSYNAGLGLIPSTTMVDEIADVKAVRSGEKTIVYASGSFQPRIYAKEAGEKSFKALYSGEGDFGMIESLQVLDGGLGFVTDDSAFILPVSHGGGASSTPNASASSTAPPGSRAIPHGWAEANAAAARAAAALGAEPTCLAFAPSEARPRHQGGVASLSELWLLKRRYGTPYAEKMRNLNGIYLQTGFVNTKLDFYRKLMRERGVNMLTVDMKDDFGRLRFAPRTESVKAMSRTASPIDVEKFVSTMKADGVYLVARIVAFKDEVAYRHSGGKYAVWDSKLKKPWQGYDLEEKKPDPAPSASPGSARTPTSAPVIAPSPSAKKEYVQDPIEEYWVDPYCEDIWRYNVAIAEELVERGFDEIQFDYIRFPTDGENLADASYRYRDPGMDKESAIMSFLAYAREHIRAPISVDIYGANGYYRTGVRTGQDVEMFRHYVDAICPMYYPSHFEQDFYAMKPEIERQWRIYYFGTLRNTYIGRFRVVVRPWVQAFKMNVRQDRLYYGPDYVLRQIKGVRDAGGYGLTFWNNSGRYDDLPMAQGPAHSGTAKAGSAPNLLLD